MNHPSGDRLIRCSGAGKTRQRKPRNPPTRCQLLPEAAFIDAVSGLNTANAFAAKNAIDGNGWTDLYVTNPSGESFVDVGLRLTDIAPELAHLLPRVSDFCATSLSYITSGTDRRDSWGTYETIAWCFGFDHDSFVKLETDDDMVITIWFEIQGENAGHKQAVSRAIMAIHDRTPCMIPDYAAQVAGRLLRLDIPRALSGIMSRRFLNAFTI